MPIFDAGGQYPLDGIFRETDMAWVNRKQMKLVGRDLTSRYSLLVELYIMLFNKGKRW